MVLLLALEKGYTSYRPVCLVDLPLDVALKHESDICTDLMKYDEDISDVLVYSGREFDKDSLPKSLDAVPFYYNSWLFVVEKKVG